MEKKNFVLALLVILLVGGVFGFILGKNNKVDNTPEDKVVIIDGENIPKEEEKKDDVVIKKPAPQVPKEDEPVACTADAMMCPDGSYVGRVAPDCNFAMCPVPAGVAEKTLSVGESLEVGGTKMRFEGVKQDSRCYLYENCITVVRPDAFVIYVSFEGVMSIIPMEMDWANPYIFRNKKIQIIGVQPAKTIKGMFSQDQYKVTFRIE